MAPYGTLSLSPVLRLTYWIVLCMAGGLGAALARYGLNAKRPDSSLIAQAIAQSLGASLVVYIILVCYSVTYYETLTVTHLITLPVFIWIISIIICGFGVLMAARKEQSDTTQRPALFERIKPSLRQSDIYALCAEDHYVRVFTSGGEDLILMRLSDAIKETVPLIGLSTHRSWWVAESGVKSVKKKSGKTEIILKNDRSVPVSRNNLKRIKDAAWI